MTEARAEQYDYGSKYTSAGRIGSLLIDRFYMGVERLFQQTESRTVLEVGCGEGFSTMRLAQLVHRRGELRSLDVEQRLVEAARARNPGVQIDLGSVYELPHPDGSFDLVCCMEVLEHLTDPRAALRELSRVSGRWLLLTVPREPLWRALNLCRLEYVSDLGNTPGHIQHWSRRGFLQLVGDYGRVVAVRTPTPWTQVLLEVRPAR